MKPNLGQLLYRSLSDKLGVRLKQLHAAASIGVGMLHIQSLYRLGSKELVVQGLVVESLDRDV